MSDVLEIDAVTREAVTRPFTAIEVAQRKADTDAAIAAQGEADAAAQARATARAALLTRLGITEAEAALLALAP